MYNVVLFGVSGCGKSSIINLLAEKPVAMVSSDANVCTIRSKCYPLTLGEKKFRLWDTMGFDEESLLPYEQAYSVLRHLRNGVDLILLCARRNGFGASIRNLYWLLDSFFFGGQAQIALVLTHFDTPDKEWWDRNRNVIAQRCNIPAQYLPHVCITTVQDGPPQSDFIYDQSKQALKALLQEYATTPTPLHLDLSSNIARAAAVENLENHCRLSILDAQTLVKTFSLPRRPFNMIFFGEMGAGKSSAINLIVGSPVAEISSSIESFPLDYRSHEVNMGIHQFLVWDIVGFNGFHNGNGVFGALKNAARLVRDLHRQGGVDLLVFCKKSGQLTSSESKILMIFHEFLCEGHIPVAFIITDLESHDPMEKWWETNEASLLKACNLKPSAVAGHACITSALDDPDLRDKLSLSRQSVQTMLEDSISGGTTFKKKQKIWVMSFLKDLLGMDGFGTMARKEGITTENLMDRCGLTRKQAEELIALLDTNNIRCELSHLILSVHSLLTELLSRGISGRVGTGRRQRVVVRRKFWTQQQQLYLLVNTFVTDMCA